jgi:hypothetical protein
MARKVSKYNSVAGLARALRQLPAEATQQLRRASLDIAGDVAGDARTQATRVGGVARYVAPTIQGTRDRVPAIRMGSTTQLPSTRRNRSGSRQTVGDVMWGAEYGGGRRVTTRQFKPYRGSDTGAGYFLWPTIRADHDQIDTRYSRALLDALRGIG